MIDEDSLSMENVEPQLDPASKLLEFIERFKTELNELTQEYEKYFFDLFKIKL